MTSLFEFNPDHFSDTWPKGNFVRKHLTKTGIAGFELCSAVLPLDTFSSQPSKCQIRRPPPPPTTTTTTTTTTKWKRMVPARDWRWSMMSHRCIDFIDDLSINLIILIVTWSTLINLSVIFRKKSFSLLIILTSKSWFTSILNALKWRENFFAEIK